MYYCFYAAFTITDIWTWKDDMKTMVYLKYDNDRAMQCPDPRSSIKDKKEPGIAH